MSAIQVRSGCFFLSAILNCSLKHHNTLPNNMSIIVRRSYDNKNYSIRQLLGWQDFFEKHLGCVVLNRGNLGNHFVSFWLERCPGKHLWGKQFPLYGLAWLGGMLFPSFVHPFPTFHIRCLGEGWALPGFSHLSTTLFPPFIPVD